MNHDDLVVSTERYFSSWSENDAPSWLRKMVLKPSESPGG